MTEWNPATSSSLRDVFKNLFLREYYPQFLQTSLQHCESLYIFPRGYQRFEDLKLFDVEEKIIQEINSGSLSILVFGDSGTGKSCFCLHLTKTIFATAQNIIPIYMSLRRVEQKQEEMMVNQTCGDFLMSFLRLHLNYFNVSNELELEKFYLNVASQNLVFILDGYDELMKKTNLWEVNKWVETRFRVQTVVSCRSIALAEFSVSHNFSFTKHHRSQVPKEMFISKLNKEQIMAYVEKVPGFLRRTKYEKGNLAAKIEPWMLAKKVSRTNLKWELNSDQYKKWFLHNLPELESLSQNIFILTMICQILPAISEDYENSVDSAFCEKMEKMCLTEVGIYDKFAECWFKYQVEKVIDSRHPSQLCSISNYLFQYFFSYAQNLSTYYLHLKGGYVLDGSMDIAQTEKWDLWVPIHYEGVVSSEPYNAHKNLFPTNENDKDENKLQNLQALRNACLLNYNPVLKKVLFMHSSLIQYFASRDIFCGLRAKLNFFVNHGGPRDKTYFPFNQANINDPKYVDAFNFLVERAKTDQVFQNLLLKAVRMSGEVAGLKTLSANSMSVLTQSRFCFSGLDLKNVQIPQANLKNGVFGNADFRGANFEGANVTQSWFSGCQLQGANFKDCNFGLEQAPIKLGVTEVLDIGIHCDSEKGQQMIAILCEDVRENFSILVVKFYTYDDKFHLALDNTVDLHSVERGRAYRWGCLEKIGQTFICHSSYLFAYKKLYISFEWDSSTPNIVKQAQSDKIRDNELWRVSPSNKKFIVLNSHPIFVSKEKFLKTNPHGYYGARIVTSPVGSVYMLTCYEIYYETSNVNASDGPAVSQEIEPVLKKQYVLGRRSPLYRKTEFAIELCLQLSDNDQNVYFDGMSTVGIFSSDNFYILDIAEDRVLKKIPKPLPSLIIKEIPCMISGAYDKSTVEFSQGSEFIAYCTNALYIWRRLDNRTCQVCSDVLLATNPFMKFSSSLRLFGVHVLDGFSKILIFDVETGKIMQVIDDHSPFIFVGIDKERSGEQSLLFVRDGHLHSTQVSVASSVSYPEVRNDIAKGRISLDGLSMLLMEHGDRRNSLIKLFEGTTAVSKKLVVEIDVPYIGSDIMFTPSKHLVLTCIAQKGENLWVKKIVVLHGITGLQVEYSNTEVVGGSQLQLDEIHQRVFVYQKNSSLAVFNVVETGNDSRPVELIQFSTIALHGDLGTGHIYTDVNFSNLNYIPPVYLYEAPSYLWMWDLKTMEFTRLNIRYKRDYKAFHGTNLVTLLSKGRGTSIYKGSVNIPRGEVIISQINKGETEALQVPELKWLIFYDKEKLEIYNSFSMQILFILKPFDPLEYVKCQIGQTTSQTVLQLWNKVGQFTEITLNGNLLNLLAEEEKVSEFRDWRVTSFEKPSFLFSLFGANVSTARNVDESKAKILNYFGCSGIPSSSRSRYVSFPELFQPVTDGNESILHLWCNSPTDLTTMWTVTVIAEKKKGKFGTVLLDTHTALVIEGVRNKRHFAIRAELTRNRRKRVKVCVKRVDNKSEYLGIKDKYVARQSQITEQVGKQLLDDIWSDTQRLLPYNIFHNNCNTWCQQKLGRAGVVISKRGKFFGIKLHLPSMFFRREDLNQQLTYPTFATLSI